VGILYPCELNLSQGKELSFTFSSLPNNVQYVHKTLNLHHARTNTKARITRNTHTLTYTHTHTTQIALSYLLSFIIDR